MKKVCRPLAALCAGAILCLSASFSHAQTTQAARATAAASSNDLAHAVASPPALVRRIASLRIASTPMGSRVTLTSDSSLGDFNASQQGTRFTLTLPRAQAAFTHTSLEGRGFTRANVESRGDALLFLFDLEPDATVQTRLSFNRLDIYFNARSGAQASTQTSSAQTTLAPAQDPPPPAATPTPHPPPVGTPPSVSVELQASGDKPVLPRGVELPADKKAAVRIPRFDKPPTIDGRLDEEVWKQAARFTNFIQIRPGDNIPPTQPTEAYMGFDSKFLYIAFRALDDPSKVRSTIAKRDQISEDDYVGVFLDTFNDQRKAYEFLFNPLGVQADAIFTEGQGEDFSVDVVIESKGSVGDGGYVVEVAVPFKSLRYVAGKDKQWGVHFMRTIQRANREQSSWMPMSRDNSSTLGQAGRITGLEGLSTERTLELIPSLTISQTGRRTNRPVPGTPVGIGGRAAPADRILNPPPELDFGVTAKYTITPQVTLDFTYNPDFAQVEADATVITANQRFPIFFEEKRPFFLEGKEIFETIISAVHTRAIVDPDYAVKLTGKQGRNTFGVMMASDIAPGNLDDDEREFILATENTTDPSELARRNELLKVLDKNATIGVLRLKRDVGKENHVGFLATTYNFVDHYNHVAGFDGRFRLNPTTTLTVQALGSNTHQPFFYPFEGVVDDRAEKGMAYAVFLNSDGRNWGYEAGIVGRSKYFRADVGFNRRFDTNNPIFFIRYQSTEKPKNFLINWRAYNFFGANFDWRGRSQNFDNNTQLQLNFQRQSFFGFGVEEGFERVFEDEFGVSRDAACINDPDPNTRCSAAFFGPDNERSATRKSFYFFGGTTPSKKFSLFIVNGFNFGVLDFDFGAGPRFPRVSPAYLAYLADTNPNKVEPALDPGVGNSWNVEANFDYQPTNAMRLSLAYNKSRLRRRDTDRVAFDDNVFTLRGTYQFTRFWFARARADYTTLGSVVRLQTLLGWTPNPGTSLYVGYNDDLNRNGFNPFTGALEPGFRRNNRTFFIKMSYLFRRSF